MRRHAPGSLQSEDPFGGSRDGAEVETEDEADDEADDE